MNTKTMNKTRLAIMLEESDVSAVIAWSSLNEKKVMIVTNIHEHENSDSRITLIVNVYANDNEYHLEYQLKDQWYWHTKEINGQCTAQIISLGNYEEVINFISNI